MTKQLKKALVAMAVAGALGLAAAPASADVYAVSHLNVPTLTFSGTAPTGPVTFVFDLRNTGTLNAGGDAAFATCGGTNLANNCGAAPVLDPRAAEVPLGARGGQNNYNFVGQTSSYGSSDSIIRSAQLVNGVPSSSQQIAEANLQEPTQGFAGGNAELQSATTLRLQVEVTGGSFSLRFSADPDQQVLINELLSGAYSSQSNLQAEFTFFRNDGGVRIEWTPQDTGAENDCVVSGGASGSVQCVETADGADLNRVLAIGDNPSSDENSFEAATILAAFGIDVTGLPSGTYTLGLDATTSVTVFRQIGEVPEPRSLALVGIGLLAMGLGLRRRSQKP